MNYINKRKKKSIRCIQAETRPTYKHYKHQEESRIRATKNTATIFIALRTWEETEWWNSDLNYQKNDSLDKCK